MKIDIFAHIIPPKFKETMFKNDFCIREGWTKGLSAVPTYYDLEARFRLMDKHPDVFQVLTLSGASPDDLAGSEEAVDIAKRINDEMAELVYKYPERFVGAAAVLPMSNIDAALTEIDRAINELRLNGILLRIPINGKPVDRPEFMPIYEKMCQYNLPIWFHPKRSRKTPDYADESESKYNIHGVWGMIWETTISMTRLVFSGVLQKYPALKIITHHCGGMVPYYSQRILNHYNQRVMRNGMNYTVGLTEPYIEYFHRFYTDTCITGNTPALMCGYHFFGAEHILFGTDTPNDAQIGHTVTGCTIEAIEQMDIPDSDKKKIFEDNARQLLRLPI